MYWGLARIGTEIRTLYNDDMQVFLCVGTDAYLSLSDGALRPGAGRLAKWGGEKEQLGLPRSVGRLRERLPRISATQKRRRRLIQNNIAWEEKEKEDALASDKGGSGFSRLMADSLRETAISIFGPCCFGRLLSKVTPI